MSMRQKEANPQHESGTPSIAKAEKGRKSKDIKKRKEGGLRKKSGNSALWERKKVAFLFLALSSFSPHLFNLPQCGVFFFLPSVKSLHFSCCVC